MKEVWKGALVAGAMGLPVGFTLNYFFLPVPETELANAIENGFGGFFSGFMGAFVSLMKNKPSK